MEVDGVYVHLHDRPCDYCCVRNLPGWEQTIMSNIIELIVVALVVAWALIFLAKELGKTLGAFRTREKGNCNSCGCGSASTSGPASII